MAVLKASSDAFGINSASGHGRVVYSSYTINICIWGERMPGAEEDLRLNLGERNHLSKTMGVEPTLRTMVDVLSAPSLNQPSNEWRTMEAVQRVGPTVTETSFRVGGERLTVGSHPGITMKALMEPQRDRLVRVVGAVVLAKISPSDTLYHAFPFDVTLELGSSLIVYEREGCIGPEQLNDFQWLEKPCAISEGVFTGIVLYSFQGYCTRNASDRRLKLELNHIAETDN